MAEKMTIGLIGPPGAGKTRLVTTLLQGWYQAGRLAKPSVSVREFLSQGPQPTKAATNLTVKVERGRGRIHGNITFLDGPGETLTEAVEALPEGSREARPILTLLDQCDVILFVIDPAIADTDARTATLERAYHTTSGLLRSLLARRGNRYLPVMFVLTRHDQWATTPALRSAAETWANRVNRTIKALYRESLTGHYPSELTDVDLTTSAVNVAAFEPAEALLERAIRLVRSTRAFDPVPLPVRMLVRSALLVLVVGFLVLALWLAASTAKPPTPPPSLKTLLEQAPGVQLHEPDAAKAVNQQLRIEPDADAEHAVRTKAEAVAARPTEAGVTTLGLYLAGLPERAGDLQAAQTAYWQAFRRLAQVRTAGLSAPVPMASILALSDELDRLRELATRSDVAGVSESSSVVEDLERAVAFLRQIGKTGGLTGRLQISGGRVSGAAGDRRVSYRSGSRAFPAIRLRTMKLGQAWSLEPAATAMDVVMAVGEPGVLSLERRNRDNTGWESEAELELPKQASIWSMPGTFDLAREDVELRGALRTATELPKVLQPASSGSP